MAWGMASPTAPSARVRFKRASTSGACLHPVAPGPLPWAPRILPAVQALVERAPDRTVFSRFMPPDKPHDLPGAWQAFYECWRHLNGEVMAPEWLELSPRSVL